LRAFRRTTQPIKVAGTLRRAVRWSEFKMIPGERHMKCSYYFDFCRLCLDSKTEMQRELGFGNTKHAIQTHVFLFL
jgi:hypothetical protein